MQPHPERRKQLAEIERRSWQLWIISLAITGGLAAGMMLLLFPIMAGYVHSLELERKGLPQLVFGLMILVILAGFYAVMKQRELNALRNYIIASYVSAAFPAADYPRDALTGMLDRSALPDLLKTEQARADRMGVPFSVVILDIRGFRSLNEREGNLVGDSVLKEFGLVLSRTIRHSDSVLRYAADEFLSLLAGSPRAGADVFVQRVERGCERVDRLRGVTFTSGISEYRSGTDPERMVGDAENDLREKKT